MTITRPDANRLLPVAPFDMVVFGGTGDLAMRKLMPALLRRDIDGQIAPESRIISIGRSPVEDNAYARRVEESCRREAGEAFTEKSWSSFAHRLLMLRSTRRTRMATAACMICSARTVPSLTERALRRPAKRLPQLACAYFISPQLPSCSARLASDWARLIL